MKAKSVIVVLLVALVLLMAAATASAKPVERGYGATLHELNGSGVSGMVAITKLPGQLKVSVWAYGLVPRRQHAQGIYGYQDGSPAMMPGPDADTNQDGWLQLSEAMESTGPLLLALTPYPVAKKSGFIVFTWVYRGSSLAKLDPFDVPLTKRAVMLQGGFWSSAYGMDEWDATLPVAIGRIAGR